MVRHVVKHIGDSASWSDGVDGDLLAAAVFGQYRNKRFDRALRSGVKRVIGNEESARSVGARQDNAATWTKMLVGFASDEKLASGVDAEDAIKLFLETG